MKWLRLFSFLKRENWRAFWRRPAVLTPVFIALASLIINWFMATKFLASETVILRYSIYVGTNWLTPTAWIFWLPLSGSLIALLDIGLAYFLARSSLVLKYLLLWSAVFSALGLLWLNWLLFRINI